jgi:hypothetical protein
MDEGNNLDWRKSWWLYGVWRLKVSWAVQSMRAEADGAAITGFHDIVGPLLSHGDPTQTQIQIKQGMEGGELLHLSRCGTCQLTICSAHRACNLDSPANQSTLD